MKVEATNLLTVKHYADKAGVSTTYVYRMVREGKIDAVVIDGVQFIDVVKFPSIKKG